MAPWGRVLRTLGAMLLLAAAGTAPARAAGDAQAFLAAWRQALAQPGAQPLADLTAFPFLFEGQPLDRAAFVAVAAPALFTPAARRCLRRARPLAEDGRLVMTCAPYGYVLAPTPAGWRLVEFFVD